VITLPKQRAIAESWAARDLAAGAAPSR
jgi:hypothetical protein